ncbi:MULTISPECIES: class I SAM-dependent methyltransferase [Lactobacillus]|uniref:Class I SAM-dependent methyltransferase n=1 Tax=Lactobacillus xujianguonis TaxID=2495899 RepID=A0A437SWV7_9LACO|nr:MULTISPECIES: class I SAM-dependent methyltransferase [Lactobacillus]RVU71404.1 class I SAM-dependent methyltransferase [Lactobacillus xujianguonis]RVU76935.1 class I SAM-dependent methyltransferase [Lactobacillus xujianguonis]
MTNEKNQMYFAANPTAKHDEHLVDYHVDKIDLKFTTDAGVFSKMRVDYGSGVLIKAMKEQTFPAGKILDAGTGYGPIGLFAAKFWPERTVEMIDVNERGLELAKRNAALNQISNVKIYPSDVYAQVDKNTKFGLILTNPPIRAGKKVVSAIIGEAIDHLTAGGILLVVIQKKQGEPSARKLMTEVYGNCEILVRDKGYYILKAIKD